MTKKRAPTGIEITEEFRQALQLLEETRRNVFITGKAGTGKSTLLQHFRQATPKNVAVLAPTGVAAVNVAGETIHSFFRFRPDITPDRVRRLDEKRRELYQHLDTVVIDEISMVRADLLDCVARFLERNGPDPGAPFGGVQMVFFGDLYQLPPVVQKGERELFKSYYESPYFFGAHGFPKLDLAWVELTKLFRHRDEEFLQVLNAIRNDTVTDEELALVNARLHEDADPAEYEDYLFLTTTNDRASRINRDQLERLPARKHVFHAQVQGTFDSSAYPTERELELKQGARVMLLNNDPLGRWINGTMATVTAIDASEEESLTVELPDGSHYTVGRFQWDMFRFELEEGQLKPVSVGQFIQMPVRLAWAVTIHKSQGLTLDRVVVDLTRSTFAHGQLYVALSRLRSLQGLVLTKPVKKAHIRLDRRVRQFVTSYQYRLADASHPLEGKLGMIRQAIQDGEDLEIVYLKASDEKSRRRITPLEVGDMEYGGKTFPGVRAYCHTRKDERMFRVDRMLELKPA